MPSDAFYKGQVRFSRRLIHIKNVVAHANRDA